MADITIRVEVVLCPDQALQRREPGSTWPRRAGVKVHFEKAGAKGEAATTDGQGVAVSPELPDGTYTVRIDPAAVPANWTVQSVPNPLQVDADRAKQQQRIMLVPPIGHRFVPLLVRGKEEGGQTAPLPGADVTMEALGKARWSDSFRADADGRVQALVPHHDRSGQPITEVRLNFQKAKKDGRDFEPAYGEITFGVPNGDDPVVDEPAFDYLPAEPQLERFRGISVRPKIRKPSGREVALAGAKVTVKLEGSSSRTAEHTGTLEDNEEEVRFQDLEAGLYTVTVTPPATFEDWPLKAGPKEVGPHYLRTDELFAADVEPFGFEQINLLIKTPGDRPLDQAVPLVIFGPDGSTQVAVKAGKSSAAAPSNGPLKIKFASGAAAPTVGGVPLEMQAPEQEVGTPPSVTEVALQYQHAIMGRAVDESSRPMPGAVVVLYDDGQLAARAVADNDGNFTAGVKKAGSYSIAIQTEGGQPVSQQLVSVQSAVYVGDVVYRRWVPPSGRDVSPQDRGGKDEPELGRTTREAFTDLAAYPVLTEEISTTGAPAPVAGGTGGAAGTGYGQTVDQVMRDVLGWRPGGDAAGFQAALAGAFQLREVEGHTEWTWQQRGYAVQADMGALTGAQASIYARAKAAVDQIQPLLAGLTAINPALYPPQDLETIRTIVATELNELVSELGLEGGPRLQRVDQLFSQLLGPGRDRPDTNPDKPDMNPDRVKGQLGQLRDRFGLTVAQVQTLDEERIVTNFRVIVDQVLALDASWQTDRKLFSRDVFSGEASKTSFGTTLIWLSRSLEAVVESVDDLNFAMDSVFVDAAQRQVIELVFQENKEPPIILSDLLDWVVRTCRDDGPRMIQDAGKDGVIAVAQVLEKLRRLIRETIDISFSHSRMPAGMKTPRVRRAFQVLAKQLHEAANLATSVRRDEAPHISAAWVEKTSNSEEVAVSLIGRNFRDGAFTEFLPDSTELGVQRAKHTHVVQPNLAVALFSGGWTMWFDMAGLITLTNEDGTSSNEVRISFGN